MSGSQPLVSIVIPVYNTEVYLARAVESVMTQSVCDWELILVDDGSTDASGQMCDAYAQSDARVRVVHQANAGLSCARNAGMALATGTWLYFIDSDDWIEPDALERLLAHSADADVVMGHYPEKTLPWRNVDAPRTFVPPQATPEELSELFFLKMFHPVWNKLYRRERITGGFEPGLYHIEDVTFNLQQWPNWRRVTVIPDTTYHYTVRVDSLSFTLRLDRMRQVRRSFGELCALLRECPDAMRVQSLWYADELRMYLSCVDGAQQLPREHRDLLMAVCVAECAPDAELLQFGGRSTWHRHVPALLRDQDVQGLLRLNGQPLVSIVIPVYNTEKYLPRVIGSVMEQSMRDWELILVDDGSTDGSGAACDRFAAQDGRIRVVHTPNGGSSAARNAGMAQAQGEWLLFIDSDDWIVPDALARLLAHAGDADVVIGHYPGQKAPWRTVAEPTLFCMDSLTPQDMEQLFFLRMFHSPVNKLYRRPGIAVPFRTDVSYIDDVTFLIANFAHWRRVVVLPDDTYRVEERGDSLMHSWRVDRMEQVRESIRLFRGLFPDGSMVMDVLSRWYVIEMRMYMYHFTRAGMPEAAKQLMMLMWLDDTDFDHSRISTARLNAELTAFWEACLRKDTQALTTYLENM